MIYQSLTTLHLFKANDYVGNIASTTTKAMLLNYVVMGKAIKMTANQPQLTEVSTEHLYRVVFC